VAARHRHAQAPRESGGVKFAGALMLASSLLAGSMAAAQSAPPTDSVTQVPLSENGAMRQWLKGYGIDLTDHLVFTPGVNTAGYLGRGATWPLSLDFGAIIDTDKLFGFDGIVRMVFSDRSGDAINVRYTGGYVQNQAYWGQGQNLRFDELSYQRFFLERRLDLKGGFYSMGNDYGGLPDVCNFTNNSQCGHPLGLIYNSGWLDNPTGQWGMRIRWRGPSGWYAQTGIYDVTPSRKQAGDGFKLSLSGRTGWLFPTEVGYVHGQSPSAYPGTYKAGFYFDTSDAPVLGRDGQTASHRTGEYVQAEQRVWKPSANTVRGLSAFAIGTHADAATGLMPWSWEAGMSWRGALPDRKDDFLSLAWTRVDISHRLHDAQQAAGKPAQTHEQHYELNYGAQIAPWLLLRPTVQYVIRPGAYANRPDSWVFSWYVQMTL
jgi:porin